MVNPPAPLPSRLLPFIAHFLGEQKWAFALLTFISSFWAIEQVFFPYAIKMMVDALSAYEGDRANIMTALMPALQLGAIVWGLSVFAWRSADIIDYRFSPRLQASIRTRITDYVFGHSHRYFSEHMAGSIANKINDVVRGVHYLVGQTTRYFLPNFVMVLLAAAMIARIDVWMGATVFGWAMLHVGMCIAFSKLCDKVAQTHSELRSELSGRIVDSISNFSSVRLFARATFERSVIAQHQADEVRAHKRMLYVVAMVRAALELPCLLMMALVLWLLISGWQAGHISTGDIVFVLSLAFNMMYILWRIGMEFPSFYREIGTCKQAISLIRAPHEVIDSPGAYPLVVNKGEITFENVTFHYRPGINLFENKNLTIQAGEKVGLVGFSGSGKSSFVNLLLRLYDIPLGRIIIDGQNIADVTQDSLRAQIAMIPQDPSLFHRSLRENIRYGNPEASEEDILRAAKLAHCHEFISATPEGYDAIVGERGVKLSGGQRQRIALARAILKNAPILVLDEATSALDSDTENAIQHSLLSAFAGRTSIVIAHRLSTLTHMDRILVFSEGAIIEDGSHEALLAAGGHYAHLWRLQAAGFLPDAPAPNQA
jgi:ATP-binding cassette, subfamily B, bacterial